MLTKPTNNPNEWKIYFGQDGDKHLNVRHVPGGRLSIQITFESQAKTEDPYGLASFRAMREKRIKDTMADDADVKRLAAAERSLADARRFLEEAEQRFAKANARLEEMAVDCASRANVEKQSNDLEAIRTEVQARRNAVETLTQMRAKRDKTANAIASEITNRIALQISKELRQRRKEICAKIEARVNGVGYVATAEDSDLIGELVRIDRCLHLPPFLDSVAPRMLAEVVKVAEVAKVPAVEQPELVTV